MCLNVWLATSEGFSLWDCQQLKVAVCVCACVRACVRACVCVRVRVHLLHNYALTLVDIYIYLYLFF